MRRFIKLRDGAFGLADDRFAAVADDEALPPGDVILSLTRFQTDGEALLSEGRQVGVRVASDEAVEALAYDLPRIAVVALEFPKYRDGRAFTSARLLRERLGYQGEVRAVGDVLRTLAGFMVRCGFDAFEPADGSTTEDWARGHPAFPSRLSTRRRRSQPRLRGAGSVSLAFDLVDWRQTLAARLDAELRHAHPRTVLEAAVAELADRLALVSSFGAESAVLLHLAAQIKRDIPVLFLDTGMLFGQTLDYRRHLAARLGLTDVRDLRPAYQDLAVADPEAKLWQTDTDACCEVRKVLPLDRALAGFEGWITGRKRFQGGSRLSMAVVEQADHQIKFNPLANWTKEDLDAYAAEHDLPAHPLVAQGFPSIGCWPCTKPVEAGQDERSGRWADSEKTECGIHVARAPGTVEDVGGGI